MRINFKAMTLFAIRSSLFAIRQSHLHVVRDPVFIFTDLQLSQFCFLAFLCALCVLSGEVTASTASDAGFAIRFSDSGEKQKANSGIA